MGQCGGIKVVFDGSENERRAINSNRHAVFAAYLQRINEVNVLSKGYA